MSQLLDQLRPMVADPDKGPEVDHLLCREIDHLIAALQGPDFEPSTPFSSDELLHRVTTYQELTFSSAQAFAQVGYWAPPTVARRACQLIGETANCREQRGGIQGWLRLYSYPAGLLFYGFGLGALAADRYDSLATLFFQPMQDRRGEWVTALAELHNTGALDHELAKALPEMARRHTPSSDWLCETLQPWLAEIHRTTVRHERAFDRFEVLVGLAYIGAVHRGWAPTGRFRWRARNGDSAADELLSAIDADSAGSPLAGSLFSSPASLVDAATAYRSFLRSIPSHF